MRHRMTFHGYPKTGTSLVQIIRPWRPSTNMTAQSEPQRHGHDHRATTTTTTTATRALPHRAFEKRAAASVPYSGAAWRPAGALARPIITSGGLGARRGAGEGEGRRAARAHAPDRPPRRPRRAAPQRLPPVPGTPTTLLQPLVSPWSRRGADGPRSSATPCPGSTRPVARSDWRTRLGSKRPAPTVGANFF